VAVPGPDDRARARKPLCLFVFVYLTCRLSNLILDQTIRPGDAYRIGLLLATKAKNQRCALIQLLLIFGARLYLNLCTECELQIADTLKTYTDPRIPGVRAVEELPGATGEIDPTVNLPVSLRCERQIHPCGRF
jgi:hypothetical protein